MRKPIDKKIDIFIKRLSSHSWPLCFNPWRQKNELDIHARAANMRRERLKLHLSCPRPEYLCIGEAPGHRGCLASGCAFTSEKLLLDGAIPRINIYGQRITNRPLPLTEPSASIFWRTLYELNIAESTILWNAFAFHPYKDGNKLSNRTPTDKELIRGKNILYEFLDMFPHSKIIAVGKKAQQTLALLDVTLMKCIRHPANGGAKEFRAGLKSCVRVK